MMKGSRLASSSIAAGGERGKTRSFLGGGVFWVWTGVWSGIGE